MKSKIVELDIMVTNTPTIKMCDGFLKFRTVALWL